MSKPRLAFVDHALHKTTKSAEFLRDIFREHYEVIDYWDESWRGGPSVPPEELNTCAAVFFLQVMNPVTELRKITVPMVWAPMYDGFKFNYAYLKVLATLNLKVLSFSERVGTWIQQFGIPVMTVQYYYLPPESAPQTPGNRLFFWYRGGIEFSDIARILDPEQIDSFTIFERTDPGKKQLVITADEKVRYKIRHMVEEFLPRERYLDMLRSATIFVAPRKKEGIGAFTEALALGKCVIAYNDAVHNEYITNGSDGFLFDEHSPQIDLSNREQIATAALARAVKAYERWVDERAKIVPFMREHYTPTSRPLSTLFWTTLYRGTAFYFKVRYYVVVKVPAFIRLQFFPAGKPGHNRA